MKKIKNKLSSVILVSILVLSLSFIFVISSSNSIYIDENLRISYIVQPDRININSDYDILTFQNDEVIFDLYLTNTGSEVLDDVTATLILPDIPGFKIAKNTASYSNIAQGSTVKRNLGFVTENLAKGNYNITLKITYLLHTTEYSHNLNLSVIVKEVGVYEIKHTKSSQYIDSSIEEFLNPIDSAILGYQAMFASTHNDLFKLTIYNGRSENIENLNIEIIPRDDIDIEFIIPSTTNELISKSWEQYFINVITDNIKPGKYNFTLNISYTIDHTLYITEQTLTFGIFNVSLESTVKIIGNTALTKSFLVESITETETPNKDIMKISSDFDLNDITKPVNADVINESIKEIVEDAFSLYYNNAEFNHTRSNWLKTYLQDKTDGEVNITARALLNDFKFMTGKIIGHDLIRKITAKELEKEGFNALIELYSEAAASKAGSYYGENYLNNEFRNSIFFDNYLTLIKTEDPLIRTQPVDISSAEIFLNLSIATNDLPIYWSLIYDEDTSFTPPYGDINMDNLPMGLVIDLRQFNQLYNIDGSYSIGIIIKSSNNSYFYEQGAFGDYATLNIDRLEKSDYYNTVIFVDLSDIGKNVAGVSEKLVFRVTDNNQPEKSHNDVLDFLSQKDIEIMGMSSDFYKELTIPKQEGALGSRTSYIFDKSTMYEGGGENITLISTRYNSNTDITTLLFNITTNKTDEFEFNVTTSFIEDYPLNENIRVVQKKIINVPITQGITKQLVVEVDGRFGDDFNSIEASIHASPGVVVVIIGVTAATITIIGGVWCIIGWCTDEFEIQFNDNELTTTIRSVYVGEIFEPEFIIHFQAKGPLDYDETYRLHYKVMPSGDTDTTDPFEGGADWPVTPEGIIEGPICEDDLGQMTIEASVDRRSHWFYTNTPDPAWECIPGRYRWCEPFGFPPPCDIYDYKCRKWEDYWGGTISGTLIFNVKNPLKIHSMEVNPGEVEHDDPTELKVEVEFKQHEGSEGGITYEGSPDITITDMPIDCSEPCEIDPDPTSAEWSFTIAKNTVGYPTFDVKHTGSHPPDDITIDLTIGECTVSGEGTNSGHDWSVTAPNDGDRSTSFVCKATYCGDGEVQDPNTYGEHEECELPGSSNNVDCSQTTEECEGNKLKTRDEYGDCSDTSPTPDPSPSESSSPEPSPTGSPSPSEGCQCEEDDWGTPSCVVGSCGAECADGDDCGDCEYCTDDCLCDTLVPCPSPSPSPSPTSSPSPSPT